MPIYLDNVSMRNLECVFDETADCRLTLNGIHRITSVYSDTYAYNQVININYPNPNHCELSLLTYKERIHYRNSWKMI